MSDIKWVKFLPNCRDLLENRRDDQKWFVRLVLVKENGDRVTMRETMAMAVPHLRKEYGIDPNMTDLDFLSIDLPIDVLRQRYPNSHYEIESGLQDIPESVEDDDEE